MLGIPTITHEQTFKPGLANRIIAFFAKAIAISWWQTLRYFPPNKTTLTGNPLRKELFYDPPSPICKEAKCPIIYISGGSGGSQAINTAVKEILPQLLKDYIVIHQTGTSALTGDYDTLIDKRSTLPTDVQHNYYLYGHLPANQVGWLYRHASLVVARAGANTITELAAFGVPAILIPLPWSGMGEQVANAVFLERHGLAKVIKQKDLEMQLLKTIRDMIKHIHAFKKNASTLSQEIQPEAAKKLADLVEGVITGI